MVQPGDEAVPFLSEQDVQHALERAGARVACPSCESDRWAVIGGEEYTSIRIHDHASGTPKDAHLACISLVCRNCGFVRMHHTEFLAQHLQGEGSNRQA